MSCRHGKFLIGWLAVMASASIRASTTLPDLQRELETKRASEFKEYLEYHFSLSMDFDADGRIVVHKAFIGPHSKEDLFCEDTPPEGGFDFFPQARFDLYFATECLREEMPGLTIDTVHDKGVLDFQGRMDALDLTSRYDSTRADLVRLEPWAQSQLSRALRKTGLFDLLMAAWKRHVRGQSGCYLARMRDFADDRQRSLGRAGSCDLWPRLIGANRFFGPDPATAISFHPVFLQSSEQRALGRLREAGLVECLGNLLISSGERGLMEALGFSMGSQSWWLQQRMDAYAWDIWNSFCVEEWLERTRRTDGIPKDVEATLSACAHWILPPRTSGDEASRHASETGSQKPFPPPGFGWWQWADPERDAGSPESLKESRFDGFMMYARGFWVADVTMARSDSPQVKQIIDGSLSDEDLFCEPPPRKDVLDFFAMARLDLPVVLECLKLDLPALDVDAMHRTAVAEAESALKELPRKRPEGAPAPDLLDLQNTADSRIAGALETSGFYDALAGAWRRHVGGDSECYRATTSKFESRRYVFLTQGGRCQAPEQLIGLMPVMKPDLLNYVVFQTLVPGPTQDAVDKLQRRGLRTCLGQILEQAGDRDAMAKLGMLQGYASRFRSSRAVRYAWDLWRRYGLEEWIRRTSEAGEVPGEVASAIEECAQGKIPDRASRARDE